MRKATTTTNNRSTRRYRFAPATAPMILRLLLLLLLLLQFFFHPLGTAALTIGTRNAPFRSTLARTKASQPPLISVFHRRCHQMKSASSSSSSLLLSSLASSASSWNDPIVFASGSSTQPNLVAALEEAVDQAVAALPASCAQLDLAWISISSLYDGAVGGGMGASVVIPTIVQALERQHNIRLQHLIGSSVAGCVTSRASVPTRTAVITSGSGSSTPSSSADTQACLPTEYESVPAVSLTVAVLPDTHVSSFYISSADVVPNDSPTGWTRALGLSSDARMSTHEPAVVLMIPSPAFATTLPDLLAGFDAFFPQAQVLGGLASTVSSLSRTRLYHWSRRQGTSSSNDDGGMSSGGGGAGAGGGTNGCVGIILQGDVQAKAFLARGAKPVGGIYQIVKAQESTIGVIVLDEIATEALEAEDTVENDNDDDGDDDDDDNTKNEQMDARARMAQAYAKARIPKPVLAEANFVMRTLSDDDQAFMRRQLLVGLEQGGSVGRSASELARLAKGEGYRFSVHPVASAGMKDGSVTLPLGSVDVKPGTRFRFFVRDYLFAKKEVEALWLGYKKKLLDEQFASNSETKPTFRPAACIMIPTLDRGNKFFLGKPGYESGKVVEVLPTLPCITGFFANGVIGRIDGSDASKTGIQGSASGYILLGSKSGRPVYSPVAAAAEQLAKAEEEAAEKAAAAAFAAEEAKRDQRAMTSAVSTVVKESAPRSEDGELILKRREVHSGRAMTVSSVEWSVAEKTAQPTSILEGFMWDKETEVDRFRERVPLANLVSQCRLAAADPTLPKPRDWVGPLKQASRNGFVIVPECKRMEPTTGSLRRRYDLAKLVRDFTLAGVPVLSVNCDAVLFGGSLEDVTKARQVAAAAAVEQMSEDGVVVPPILASDLLLYPYQLYKLSLAGADAVNIIAGALATKDLKYLAKIASSLKLQTLITVTSEVQIGALHDTPMDGLIISNRELEDFSFDMTGEQALRLLKSSSIRELREKRGNDFPILVEGRVGIIERADDNGNPSTQRYIDELKEAGAIGAIVGGGLAGGVSDISEALKMLQVSL